jgi:hypothetical protein
MGAVVLESESHQAIARTTAFEWIRQHGGGVWTTLDGDDYYGPGYAQEVWDARARGSALGGVGDLHQARS